MEEKLKEKEEESEDEGLILLSKRETADELKPGSPEGLSDSSVEIRLTDAGGTVVATGISAPPSPIASSPSATPPSASPRKLSTDAPPFMPRRSQSAINIASQSHPTGILRTASGNITEEGFRRERRVSLAPSPLSNPAEAPTGPDGVRPWRRKSQSTPSDDPPAPSWRKERQPSSGSIHSVSSSGSRRRPSGASIASLNMTSLSTATSSNSAPAEQAPAGFIPPAFAQGRRKSLPAAAFARLKSSPTPTNAINSVVAAQLHLISEQARHLQAQVSLLESTATEPESTIHPANHTSNPSLEVFLKHLPKHTSPPALYFAASNALPGVKSVTVPFSSRDFGYLEFDNAGHMHGALEIGEFGYEGKKISVEVKRGRA